MVLIMHSGLIIGNTRRYVKRMHLKNSGERSYIQVKRVKYNPFINKRTLKCCCSKEEFVPKILAYYFCDDTWIFHSCTLFTELLMNFYKFSIKRRSEAGSNAGRCHRAIANLVGGSRWQRCVLLPSEQSLRSRSATGATPRPRYDMGL